ASARPRPSTATCAAPAPSPRRGCRSSARRVWRLCRQASGSRPTAAPRILRHSPLVIGLPAPHGPWRRAAVILLASEAFVIGTIWVVQPHLLHCLHSSDA